MCNGNDKVFDVVYTVLSGQGYDSLADAMALNDRNCGKLARKLDMLDTKLQVAANQLNLYVTNAMYKDYDCTVHSALFIDGKVQVYMYEDVRRAVIKLHEQDDEFVDEEYSAFFSYFNDDALDVDDSAMTIDAIISYLPEPLFTMEVTERQVASFQDLAEQYDNIYRQHMFVTNKLNAAQDEHDELIRAILIKVLNDDRYNFDIDEDKIIVVKNEARCTYHAIFCPTLTADELLGTFDGVLKTEILNTIAEQITVPTTTEE